MTAALKADLLQRVLEQSPAFFERLIIDLLVAMGYGGSHEDAARQLGRSGDGGIDGIIDEDRLGLDRIYVQAKRYSTGSAVGRPEVQGFVGSLVGLGASKGVFVTTSAFSKQATEYARSLQQRVVLIDGPRLTELMTEFGVGVRTTRVIDVKRLDEDFLRMMFERQQLGQFCRSQVTVKRQSLPKADSVGEALNGDNLRRRRPEI
ncbi:restriction endonuclease [Novosphingobium sp. TH158]|uniref:restriction endonuclease n=1 Tax=Novosphingobium sp. TH158 TaxID=2067455 RepID=UPI0020B16CB8|nr:restriction endonuclease [Novosphingobium sp. TH158]